MTIDLSSHGPASLRQHPKLAPANGATENAPNSLPVPLDPQESRQISATPGLVEAPPDKPPPNPDREPAVPIPLASSAPQPAEPQEQEQIQILDLHTSNPLISYRGQTYSCNWGSTLGTDVLITAAPPEVDTSYDPPIEGPRKAELLGLSTMRLTAKPVNVKMNAPTTRIMGGTAEEDTVGGSGEVRGRGGHGNGLEGSTGVGFEGLRGNERQAAFLERLAEIKRAKGEGDMVPMVGVRSTPKKPVRVEGGGRGRGKRGRAGRSRAGRGLSGRARVLAGSEVGARGGLQEAVDEGAVTPQTWDEHGDNVVAGSNDQEGTLTEGHPRIIEQEEPQGENETDDAVSLIRTAEDIDMEDV